MTEQVTAERIAKIHQLIDQHAYCDCYDSRQHEPGCPQPAFRNLLLALDAATAEREKTQRILEIERRYMERILPCSDCRDKVKQGECERCRRQKAEAELARLRARGTWRNLLIEADSMLSAAGHGRAVTKDEMKELSGRIRKAYESAPPDTEGA